MNVSKITADQSDEGIVNQVSSRLGTSTVRPSIPFNLPLRMVGFVTIVTDSHNSVAWLVAVGNTVLQIDKVARLGLVRIDGEDSDIRPGQHTGAIHLLPCSIQARGAWHIRLI